MSTLLSNGFKRPDAGDPSSTWMPEHEGNITQLNNHSHDGVDSEQLSTTVLTRPFSDILSAGWGAVTGGYEQTINTPGLISEVNDHLIKFYRTSDGALIHPTFERLTATSYKLTTNDNTLTLKAIYI